MDQDFCYCISVVACKFLLKTHRFVALIVERLTIVPFDCSLKYQVKRQRFSARYLVDSTQTDRKSDSRIPNNMMGFIYGDIVTVIRLYCRLRNYAPRGTRDNNLSGVDMLVTAMGKGDGIIITGVETYKCRHIYIFS